jgi:predicted small lipoprotein YifL
MKNILSILTVLALAAAAQAGCGKTEASKGTVKSYDSEKKELVVTVAGKDTSFTLTPETEGADKAADLKGKSVEVNVDKHVKSKVVSVAVSAEAPKGDEPKKKGDKKKKTEKKA